MPRINDTYSKRNKCLLLHSQGWTIANIAIHLHTTQDWVKQQLNKNK